MKKRIQLKLFPKNINNSDLIKTLVAKELGLEEKKITDIHLIKRSIDARKKRPFYMLQIDAYLGGSRPMNAKFLEQLNDVSKAAEVIVIGAGPAGYFAALELISLGLRPIVLDRGKDVRMRRRDLKAIQQDGVVNPDSNYCFGEGGAGTYSDGKLYTRSYKRGKISKVLQLLVEHGATEDILIDAHPHIGSNKLPQIVANIRKTIEDFGGSVLFDHKVTDLVIKSDRIDEVVLADGSRMQAKAFILATGHSARGIFEMLDRLKIEMHAKAFALGLRIEHPQSIIDEAQYNQNPRSEFLPASSYSLVSQVGEKGVFSFCMCPGGLIVPAATAPGEIVVNGMSLSRRDSPFANSGIVTEISLKELSQHGYKGTFACLNFQKEVEQTMFADGDGSQKAPAQRLTDFLEGRRSVELNPSSYIPGLHPTNLKELLPFSVYKRLAHGLSDFGKKLENYKSKEANLVGVESRTSSPIKIPRDAEKLHHPRINNLFPCGEGAGYAGGILSAAMDGQKVAQAIHNLVKP